MSAESRNDLLERVVAANSSYYTMQRDYTFAGETFPAYGEFHTAGEQYVLVKRAKLWEVNTHDYLFFMSLPSLSVEELNKAVEFMTTQAIRKVSPGPDHMSSALSLVILADVIDEEASKALKKVKFRKNYRLSIPGWSDLRVAAVNFSAPQGSQLISNSMGKPLIEMLEGNLELTNKQL